MKNLIFLLIASLVLFSCSKDEIEPTKETETFEQSVLNILNERRTNGFEFQDVYYTTRDSLSFDDLLISVAKEYSEYMSDYGNVTYHKADGTIMYSTIGVKHEAQSPEDLVNKFMSLQCNCDLIMSSQKSRVGLNHTGLFWCLVFAN